MQDALCRAAKLAFLHHQDARYSKHFYRTCSVTSRCHDGKREHAKTLKIALNGINRGLEAFNPLVTPKYGILTFHHFGELTVYLRHKSSNKIAHQNAAKH